MRTFIAMRYVGIEKFSIGRQLLGSAKLCSSQEVGIDGIQPRREMMSHDLDEGYIFDAA